MTAKSIMQELKAICADLQIRDAYSYSFRETLYTIAASSASDATQTSHLALTQNICQQLYDQCYIRDSRQTESATTSENVTSENTELNLFPSDLTVALNKANATKENWDRGWKIYQIATNGKIFVQKADRSRSAVAGAFLSETMKSHGAQTGDLVSLRVYPANSELQAAFFHSFGSHLADQFDDYSAVRLYFNIDAEAATSLLAELSSMLNKYYVPFHFKTLVDPRQYGRADAAVLYIARRYYHFVVSLLATLPVLLGARLHDPVPMFCQRIMSGIGVAEDPGTGESFGMHRCRIVAEGLVSAWEEGTQAVDDRMRAIEKRFETYNLNLEKPYLNPFSLDIFVAVSNADNALVLSEPL
ncbi:T3SS effector HopA1 family protein [Undibacterium sp. Di24W]|uniref:T3SS effector HopA1 family protein n=1 Tax=Undibacterium sp. Di24W TaxID=3413033 RepID=UPI003BF42604